MGLDSTDAGFALSPGCSVQWLDYVQLMTRLEENKATGQLYFRIPRGIAYSIHSLDTHGVARIKRLGLSVGDRVPFSVRQLLDQHGECQPPCAAFKVRVQLDSDERSAAMAWPQLRFQHADQQSGSDAFCAGGGI